MNIEKIYNYIRISFSMPEFKVTIIQNYSAEFNKYSEYFRFLCVNKVNPKLKRTSFVFIFYLYFCGYFVVIRQHSLNLFVAVPPYVLFGCLFFSVSHYKCRFLKNNKKVSLRSRYLSHNCISIFYINEVWKKFV